MSRKEIFFDGTCGVCTSLACHLQSSKSDTIKLTNAAESDLPDSIERSSALKELHVVDEKGQIHKNYDAVLVVIRDLRFGKVLYAIGRIPVLSWFFARTYGVISRNRKSISTSLFKG